MEDDRVVIFFCFDWKLKGEKMLAVKWVQIWSCLAGDCATCFILPFRCCVGLGHCSIVDHKLWKWLLQRRQS